MIQPSAEKSVQLFLSSSKIANNKKIIPATANPMLAMICRVYILIVHFLFPQFLISQI